MKTNVFPDSFTCPDKAYGVALPRGRSGRAGGTQSQAKSAPQAGPPSPRAPTLSLGSRPHPGPALLSGQQRTGTHRRDSPELSPRRTRLGRPERRGSWGRTEGPQLPQPASLSPRPRPPRPLECERFSVSSLGSCLFM